MVTAEDGGDGMGVSGGLARFFGGSGVDKASSVQCPPVFLIGIPDPTGSVATHARFRGGDRQAARASLTRSGSGKNRIIKLCRLTPFPLPPAAFTPAAWVGFTNHPEAYGVVACHTTTRPRLRRRR